MYHIVLKTIKAFRIYINTFISLRICISDEQVVDFPFAGFF